MTSSMESVKEKTQDYLSQIPVSLTATAIEFSKWIVAK